MIVTAEREKSLQQRLFAVFGDAPMLLLGTRAPASQQVMWQREKPFVERLRAWRLASFRFARAMTPRRAAMTQKRPSKRLHLRSMPRENAERARQRKRLETKRNAFGTKKGG
jgi:hypothetical protein